MAGGKEAGGHVLRDPLPRSQLHQLLPEGDQHREQHCKPEKEREKRLEAPVEALRDPLGREGARAGACFLLARAKVIFSFSCSRSHRHRRQNEHAEGHASGHAIRDGVLEER